MKTSSSNKPTIIMPTKNRAELLETAVTDVLSQQHGDFYLLIVDHNSEDNTREVVEGFHDSRITYLHHRGYQDAAFSPKNYGLANVPEDSIGVIFRDDDDRYVSSQSLGYLVKAAASQGDRFGICTGNYIELNQEGKRIKTVDGGISTTDEIMKDYWFPVKASIFARDVAVDVKQLPPIRSRETILFAYFVVHMINEGMQDRTIYHTGESIVYKTRHNGAISGENVRNGNRQAAHTLFNNVHAALKLARQSNIVPYSAPANAAGAT